MARITVEDCLDHIPNRFNLVMVATKRARQFELENAEPQVPVENDKDTVLALREIAAGYDVLNLKQPDIIIAEESEESTDTE